MSRYVVLIGKRGQPRLQFEVMDRDWLCAWKRHIGLARPGDRVEVLPLEAA